LVDSEIGMAYRRPYGRVVIERAVALPEPPDPAVVDRSRTTNDEPMSSSTQDVETDTFDLRSAAVRLDPHPTLHRMRAADPVHWSEQFGGWMLTRYDDILTALKDPRLSAARMVGQIDRLPDGPRQQLDALRTSIALWMGHTNHDDHVRMQRVIKRYFTPATVAALRPRVQAITDEIIDGFQGRGGCEVVTELARPLPARVIADMLGVPAADRDLLPGWSRGISGVFGGGVELDNLLESQRCVVEMSEYMRPIVAARRAEPQDDLISLLVAAQDQGGIQSDEEILANCVLLLFAGHETTAGLIANGLHLLLEHPDQFAALRADERLLPGAIEEMLRYAGPAGTTTRLAAEALEIGGKRIEPYQVLFLVLAAGDRDPAYYPDPDRFDITRPPGRHLAFGQGTFYCLGAALARLETQVCFSTLFGRLGEIRLAPAGASWELGAGLNRRMGSLPIEFSPSPAAG
jgi:cytochrome P450